MLEPLRTKLVLHMTSPLVPLHKKLVPLRMMSPLVPLHMMSSQVLHVQLQWSPAAHRMSPLVPLHTMLPLVPLRKTLVLRLLG